MPLLHFKYMTSGEVVTIIDNTTRLEPSKVALIMMLKSDGQMLEPQVKRTRPVVVERLDINTMVKGAQA